MKNIFTRASVLVLTLAVGTLGSLYAQETQQPQPSPDTPLAGQSNQPQATQDQKAKEFTGTIVKHGGTMMLNDSAANVSYKLDDQNKAKEYVGKQVRVTGTLDSSTNVIHVDRIQIIS
jgi:lipopolysaccharide export system protein LptA